MLRAYDDQLRTDAEASGAEDVTRLGPLWLISHPGGSVQVTYRDLGGASATEVRELVRRAVTACRGLGVTAVEWKARGHDVAPGLHDALVASGFIAGEVESVMVGEAHALSVGVDIPPGIGMRRVTAAADVRAGLEMQHEVFGSALKPGGVEAMVRRLVSESEVEFWVAEHDGQVISAGRVEDVLGTAFAGLWGGATRPEWRSRGVYRALTAHRAHAALRWGKQWLHSDSTTHSRPILERAGFLAVTITTPYDLTLTS